MAQEETNRPDDEPTGGELEEGEGTGSDDKEIDDGCGK
jgi:hypothetical protein